PATQEGRISPAAAVMPPMLSFCRGAVRSAKDSGGIRLQPDLVSPSKEKRMRLNEAPVFGHQSARPIRLVVLPLLFAFTLLSAAFAQAVLPGFWLLRVPTGVGNYRETFVQFNQGGE